ncbi:universal stress protein [Streptomyces achromogenes]|uniref:universal stress protein n=1 Tax=Streptomyces achromogenes TaxID=67255 RepID=UPI0036A879E1
MRSRRAHGPSDGRGHRRDRTRQPDVKVTADVPPEEPEYALVRESRTVAAVLLGSRGRGSLAEALLGSVTVAVAVAVARWSRCSTRTPASTAVC